MMRLGRSALLVLVLCLVIALGELHAYQPADDRYASAVSVSDDAVSYDLTAAGAKEYDAVLLDNGTYTAVGAVCIYYDPGYASYVREDAPVEIGAVPMTQAYYLDQLQKVLKYRGITEIELLNAVALAERLEHDLSAGTARGTGLIVAAGALPENVYTGTADDPILQWIAAGGSLYWVGEVVGRYSAGPTAVTPVGGERLFTGTDRFNIGDSTGHDDTAVREAFSYEFNHLKYAPNLSKVTGPALAAGYTDGTYASASFLKLGEGQVCLLGGDFDSRQVRDLAISVCSGLCYCSTILAHQTGTVHSSCHAEISLTDAPATARLQLYLYLGGYFCVYGKGYAVA